MFNNFVWTDLSALDIAAAQRFYSQCFGWQFQELGNGYLNCQAQGQSSAGLFTMPEQFQQMGMPSFWMSYIHVQNIEETVRLAEQHGAKIEIKLQQAPSGGKIALIRDPAGAGFTCYEGEDPEGRDTGNAANRMVWNELHVSDLAKVEAFYSQVFGWRIQATHHAGRYEIFNTAENTQPIGGIQVTSNDIKGNYEYWGVYFSVADLSKAAKQIQRAGGKILAEQPTGDRAALLVQDPAGAAFYIVEATTVSSAETNTKTNTQSPRRFKWRAVLGLLLVALAILAEANWVWGVLFLVWVIPDIRSGSTHFLEHVERRQNPLVYWLIITTWLSLSVYLLVEGSLFAG